MRFSTVIGRRSAAVVAGVLLAVAGMATPATGAAAPSITSFYCDGSGAMYFCGVRWTGGVAPFSVQWFKDGAPIAGSTYTFLLLRCQPATSATIGAVVTDSTGASDEEDGRFVCTLL